MDISVLTDFTSVVTLVICLVLGFVIKYSFKNKKLNQFIPLISAIVGVLVYAWTVGGLTPDGLAIGLVSGLAATGLYEAVRDMLNLSYESLDNEEA